MTEKSHAQNAEQSLSLQKSQQSQLKLEFCTFKAALYAVTNWHYSKSMPAGKTVKIGVWENDRFIGVVIFSRGANNHMLMPYGLTPIQGCELTRVALDKHIAPVSKIVAIAIKILKKTNPGMKLIVSFADSRQNHKGGIYQAMNWIFTGSVKTTDDLFYKGRWMHQRTVHSLRGTIKGLEEKRDGGLRHRYLYVLDESMREQINRLGKPYPKHASVV